MITGINHITLAVADIERAFAFYRDVLGFVPKARWDSGAYLGSGDLWLALIAAPQRKERENPDYSHFALSCEARDFEDLRARLEDAGCASWSENRSEGESYYFLDPDGHQLEIHVGDLETRLDAMKINPWTEITFF